MKAFFGTCLLATCLALSVRADNASDKAASKPATPKASEVDVQASSDLRVAVVDPASGSADHTALHEAFAAALGTSMSKRCGGTVNVKVTDVDAVSIAFELKSGMYDAVFVIGNTVPPALRKGDYEVLRAVSEVGVPARVFHMVVPTDDPGLQRMVSESFPEALGNAKFQEAVNHAVAIKINSDAIKKAAKEAVVDSIR